LATILQGLGLRDSNASRVWHCAAASWLIAARRTLDAFLDISGAQLLAESARELSDRGVRPAGSPLRTSGLGLLCFSCREDLCTVKFLAYGGYGTSDGKVPMRLATRCIRRLASSPA
jgi:hypothetical protein